MTDQKPTAQTSAEPAATELTPEQTAHLEQAVEKAHRAIATTLGEIGTMPHEAVIAMAHTIGVISARLHVEVEHVVHDVSQVVRGTHAAETDSMIARAKADLDGMVADAKAEIEGSNDNEAK